MSPAERLDLPELAAVMRAVLAHRPAGLITDFDGTLSPIVPVPSEATIDPSARQALARLATQLEVVAVVSGRRAEDVRALVDLDSLIYIGNHGLETWQSGGTRLLPAAAPYVDLVQRAAGEVKTRLTEPALVIETKGATASLHYRQAAEPEAARAAILQAIKASPAAQQLRVSQGRMVINLLPPIECHKGTAVRALVAQHHLRSIVYLGDDTTDEDALAALRALRAQGLATLGIAVASPESPPALLDLADYAVGRPAEVAALLSLLGQDSAAIDPPPLQEPR